MTSPIVRRSRARRRMDQDVIRNALYVLSDHYGANGLEPFRAQVDAVIVRRRVR